MFWKKGVQLVNFYNLSQTPIVTVYNSMLVMALADTQLKLYIFYDSAVL